MSQELFLVEVAGVLALADEYRVPVVPFGAGTSLEGHVIPVRGGITLELTRMNHIVGIDTANLQATVQAGVTREQLNRHIEGVAAGSRSVSSPFG